MLTIDRLDYVLARSPTLDALGKVVAALPVPAPDNVATMAEVASLTAEWLGQEDAALTMRLCSAGARSGLSMGEPLARWWAAKLDEWHLHQVAIRVRDVNGLSAVH